MINLFSLLIFSIFISCYAQVLRVPLKRYTNTRSGRNIAVSRIKAFDNLQYYAEIGIGTPPQPFTVILDTGSYAFAIPSTRHRGTCTTCGLRRMYDGSKSSTYTKIDTPMQVRYSMGTINGLISRDSLSIAGFSLPNQLLLEIVDEPKSFNALSFDGIMGLSNSKRFSDFSPVTQMFKSGLIGKKLFGVYIKASFPPTEDGGEIMFGDTDSQKYTGTLEWMPSLSGDWEIKLDGIQVRQKNFAANRALIDTGNSVIGGPASEIDLLNNELGAIKNGFYYEVNCSKIDQLPPVTIMINQKPYTLTPREYVREIRVTNGRNYCVSGFHEYNDQNNSWVLGDTFLAKYYAAFDMDGNKVGLARNIVTRMNSKCG